MKSESAITMWSTVLVVLAAPVIIFGESPTRLYVKSDPPGAEVTVDGNAVGRSDGSDGLFELTAGPHTVRVEAPGRIPVERQTNLPAGQITRLELTLAAIPLSNPTTTPSAEAEGDAKATDAVAAFIGASDLSDTVKQAMLTVVRQHSDQLRWSGRSGDTLFGVVVKKLPADPHHAAIPALIQLTQMLAVHELLTAKSVLDLYASNGLNDATTLRHAVELAADGLDVTGSTAGAKNQATATDGYTVAYIVAEDASLRAHLSRPPQVEAVATAYREVMHAQARELMAKHDWVDAILLWRHLHQLRLVSPSLYLDAADCFIELGKPEDAVKLLGESLDAFRQNGSEKFFETAGNLAIRIDNPFAQDLAARAYRLASQRLLGTTTIGDETGSATIDSTRNHE